MATLPVSKVTFHLHADERRQMMKKVGVVVQECLHRQKKQGTLLKDVAKTIGIPAPRIYEAHKQKYLGEDTVRRLVIHHYLSPDEIVGGRFLFSVRQLAVLNNLLSAGTSSESETHASPMTRRE